MSTTYQINKLSDAHPSDGAAAVDVIDASIQQVQDALNNLSERVDNLNQKSAVVRQHVPLASGVLIGDLVYYKAYADIAEVGRSGEYDKALATTLAETQDQGQSIEAPSARVEGIVIATDPGSSPLTGTLLIGGYWVDPDVMDSCLGAGAHPGVYYLSPVNAGKGTLETNGHLRQPVLSYYGAGQFGLSLFYMAHDNHFHSSQQLDPNYWEPISDVEIDDRPAYYRYIGDTAQDLGEIGDTTAVFYNGILQNTQRPSAAGSLFAIDNDVLYYMDGATAPSDGQVILFNHYPFAYESAVIRTVYSTSDALTVRNTNGNVAITGNDFVTGATAKSSQAIYSINGRALNYTPVVTDITAGPGIDVNRALDGTAIITAASSLGGLMDAYSINHNGTTLISDASKPPFQYITFPAGRYSEYVMYLPVNDIGDTVCTAAVWLMKLGTGSPSFTIKARYIPSPTVGSPTTLSDLPLGTIAQFNTTAGDTATSLVYNEAEIPDVTVQHSGMLVAIVGCTASSQVSIMRTGFRLIVDAERTAQQVGTTAEDSTSITQTMTVAPAQTVTAGDAVMIMNSKLVVCTNYKNGLADNTNKCVGIALSSALEGQQVTYMITGTMTLPVAGEPGASLYIKPNGTIGTVADTDTFLTTARFLQKVGTILTGNKIQVNIEPAVRGNVNE